MTGGRLISIGIDERKMGDRGSKSPSGVKEQRVDGSSVSSDAVRCTLVTGKAGSWEKLSKRPYSYMK